MGSGLSGETKRFSFFSELTISELPYLPEKGSFLSSQGYHISRNAIPIVPLKLPIHLPLRPNVI
jgi:hypothetical protein